LDMIALSNLFNKSCSQVLLRMKEVLDGKLAFCGTLYEPHPERPEHWVVSYSTSTTNHTRHNIGWLKIDGFYPSKGQTVKPRSIVDRTLSSGKSHSVSYHIMQGLEEKGSWLILAQPLIIDDVVSKVAVVMLPVPEQNLLKPQIENVNPIQLEPISRYI
jgi:hypothetical protein